MIEISMSGTPSSQDLAWKTPRGSLPMGNRPLIMGILNLTPDSFSDGGYLDSTTKVMSTALAMEEAGADLLDLGAESTRPGAEPVDAETEWSRLQPALNALANRTTLPLSIDTYKPDIARRAFEFGAQIINDVSGGAWAPGMAEVIAHSGMGYVLTHSQGRPSTMHIRPDYDDVEATVETFLREELENLGDRGVHPRQVVLDPGFGFGKTGDHNWILLGSLKRVVALGRPVLVGVSRKSFLKKIAGEEGLEVSTVAAQVWASAQGAHVWRVHDVASAVPAARMVEQIRSHRNKTT